MTKLQLLQNVSEEQIIKHYLPAFNPTKKSNYKSPFTDKDEKPSLTLYKDSDAWKFKSHNTGHQGDVFQYVADIKEIDCKSNFQAVIDQISTDLQLSNNTSPDKKKNIRISYEKAFTEAFINYFSGFKISVETLDKFGIKQVKFHEFISSNDKHCKFDYHSLKQIAVCYLVNDRIKIYFPKIEGLQKKAFGFKNQTTADVFGLSQLSQLRPEKLFIAAGEKDCLALNSNGFTAISFQSENYIPDNAVIDKIKSFSDSIFVVYDNDNNEAGKKAAEKICNKYHFKSVSLPASIKDSADFFRDHTAEDFELLLIESKEAVTVTNDDTAVTDSNDDTAKFVDEDAHTIFHATEKFLSKHYDIRFNTVKLDLEFSEKGKNKYENINENDLFIHLNKKGIKVGMDKLIAILKSSFVTRFNPLHDYFKTLTRWDGKTDYIQQLCDFVKCEEHEEFSQQFAKWLMRCVRCCLVEGYYNKQAFILVHSQQNSGKSTFCRFLVPKELQDYSAENISDDKDSRVALAKNFLINLDELSSLAKHEINSLKSLFSKDLINERLPYDRKNSIIHRVASFIGSTNMAEFLTDETGSVRWLCFEIKSIDWKYSKMIDINNVWSQAFGMIKEGLESDMNKKDIERNEERNAKFQQLSSEAEMIPQYLKPATENELQAVFLSATEILIYLCSFTTIRLNKVMIGRAMPICGFIRHKEPKTDRYGYWCNKLK